MRVKELKFAG